MEKIIFNQFKSINQFISLRKRLIKFKESQLWNQLPNELKESQYSLSFKQHVKKIYAR